MKIEIDLNDILGDENGAESLQESVRRQVIESLTQSVRAGVKQKIEEETSRVINETLRLELTERMPVIVEDVLTAPYTPVSKYGEKSAPTTFRGELIKAITEQMIYKKTTYASDANAFTKAVDAVVSEHLNTFKLQFNKTVDAEFTSQVLAHASAKLKEKLGIK